MKPIVVVGVVVGSLVAGFAGASVAVRLALSDRADVSAASAEVRPETAGDAKRAPATEALSFAESDSSDIAALKQSLTGLQREVDELRAQLSRREVDASALAAGKTAGAIDVETLANLNRDAVVKILADEDKRKQELRDAERKTREQEAFNRLAERAAKDLGLSPADQQRLAEFMPVASAKRDELFRGLRDSGGPEGFRTAMDEFRTWRDTEIKGTFGESLGQQLIDYQRDSMRGGFGDFGGWGGPGGPSGNNSGGNNSGGAQGGRSGGGRGGE